MNAARRRWLWMLVLLVGLAFALRVVRLDAVPLRGDEAFAVRYWAADPRDIVRDLAREEPHPLGTFVGFWAWKQAAGDSEFAMRFLPLLGNLVGVAAIAQLGRRLLGSDRAGLIAAALWAIHPYLIWHAQDVRNYAIWAGLSALALWLFIRAADRGQRRHWLLYVAVEALALYTFFLEAFFLLGHALYLLLVRRERRAIRGALLSWALLGVLLVPWLAQIWYLADSGYQGAVGDADPAALLTKFLPTLLIGDILPAPWDALLPLLWIALVAAGWMLRRPPLPRVGLWIALSVLVPAGLLLIAAGRMSVFHPRYILAATPALLLLTTWALLPLFERRATRPARLAIAAAMFALPVLSAAVLVPYYRGEDAKSPDWPGLAAYLKARTLPGDLIVQGSLDPAFGYYYGQPADEISLRADAEPTALLRPEVNFRSGIWTLDAPPDVRDWLAEQMQPVSERQVGAFHVNQYRRWDVRSSEIAQPSGAQFGDFARLAGVTLQGPDPSTQALTVLLYWEPLRQTEIDYVVFVHLAGPGASDEDAGPLIDQDDHRPRDGFASTLSWQPGTLVRDPYHLLETPADLAPGAYRLIIGFYDPADPAARVPVTSPSGAPLGDSLALPAFEWPKSSD